MKRLISQNGVEIDSSKEFKIFECKNCGCKFESNEYGVYDIADSKLMLGHSFLEKGRGKILEDSCFTCNETCIIVERTIEN
jgi:hypothetical protein